MSNELWNHFAVNNPNAECSDFDAVTEWAADHIEILQSTITHQVKQLKVITDERDCWIANAKALQVGYNELDADKVRLMEALETTVNTLQDYASSNPKHYYRDVLQDPNGVHAALELVNKALASTSSTWPVKRP